ncbi:MAG TPA: FKBP-type peptidyl-prolyl cis-trans isomerase [Rhizomicrobium sp.]|jgi:FKBP-type peptidyl-prolyl cis-trans isomerase|nr:FKBP-type peptidyl-prolyl cis-trans isomerase [Rhizomicrobium sp.]
MHRVWALLAAAGLLFAVTARASDSSLSPAANAAFVAQSANQPGTVVRPSGLQYRIIRSGFGKKPQPLDSVSVNYKGSLINGKVFDSTEPGFPAMMKVNEVIPGWTEALELMREGDHWQLVIPANLAYGERGAGDGTIPPNQTLVFDLELLTVTPAPPEPKKDDQDSSSGGASQ